MRLVQLKLVPGFQHYLMVTSELEEDFYLSPEATDKTDELVQSLIIRSQEPRRLGASPFSTKTAVPNGEHKERHAVCWAGKSHPWPNASLPDRCNQKRPPPPNNDLAAQVGK